MDSSSPYGIYVPDWSCCSQSQEKKESVMKLIRVGVDLAKNVFQLRGIVPDIPISFLVGAKTVVTKVHPVNRKPRVSAAISSPSKNFFMATI